MTGEIDIIRIDNIIYIYSYTFGNSQKWNDVSEKYKNIFKESTYRNYLGIFGFVQLDLNGTHALSLLMEETLKDIYESIMAWI